MGREEEWAVGGERPREDEDEEGLSSNIILVRVCAVHCYRCHS